MVRGVPSEGFEDLCRGLVIEDELLRRYMKVFLNKVKFGLRDPDATLNCVVTYVQTMPTGNERGNYLALDVSGVLVRVVLICLKKMSYDLRAKQYTVPTELVTGRGEDFFDFLANCVYEFTKNNQVNMDGLPLGFSFGFPCEQRGIKSAVLLEWTKGFDCSGVLGEDVVALLEFSLSQISDLNVYVCAVIDPATGALLSCAWKDRQCKIGMVFDAGTNLCYVERVENVSRYRGDDDKEFVVINTEYGNLGNDGKIDFVRTGWDQELDHATLNSGTHISEKMISSLYLGELVRRILVTGAERGLIFRGKLTQELDTVGSFDSSNLIEISKEPVHGRITRSILTELGYTVPWSQDYTDLQYACEVIWKRSGDLAAASIAAIINHLGDTEITVSMDGFLYRSHLDYADHISKRLRQLVKSDIQFRCVVAEDGRGLGAALAAAATMGQYAGKQAEQNDDSEGVALTSSDIIGSTQPTTSADSVIVRNKQRKKSTDSDIVENRLRKKSTDSDIVENILRKKSTDSDIVENRLRKKSTDSDIVENRLRKKSTDSDIVENRPRKKSADSDILEKKTRKKSADSDIVGNRPRKKSADSDIVGNKPRKKSADSDSVGKRQRKTSADSFSSFGEPRSRGRTSMEKVNESPRNSKFYETYPDDRRTQSQRSRRSSEVSEERRGSDRTTKGSQNTRESPRISFSGIKREKQEYVNPAGRNYPPLGWKGSDLRRPTGNVGRERRGEPRSRESRSRESISRQYVPREYVPREYVPRESRTRGQYRK